MESEAIVFPKPKDPLLNAAVLAAYGLALNYEHDMRSLNSDTTHLRGELLERLFDLIEKFNSARDRELEYWRGETERLLRVLPTSYRRELPTTTELAG